LTVANDDKIGESNIVRSFARGLQKVEKMEKHKRQNETGDWRRGKSREDDQKNMTMNEGEDNARRALLTMNVL
jgi:hypothetical protein